MKEASQSMPKIKVETILDFYKNTKIDAQMQMKPVANAEEK